MTDFDIGYIVGFFEGEGCICVTHYSRKGKRKNESSFQVMVQIGNTNKAILDKICSLLGYGYVIPDRTKRKKPFYYFRVNKQADKLKFLEMIKPYLIEKKQRAELVCEFLKRRIEQNAKAYCSVDAKYSETERLWFEKYYALK